MHLFLSKISGVESTREVITQTFERASTRHLPGISFEIPYLSSLLHGMYHLRYTGTFKIQAKGPPGLAAIPPSSRRPGSMPVKPMRFYG